MKLETVEISINENSYNIEIGNNFLSEEILSDLVKEKEVLLVPVSYTHLTLPTKA